MLIRTIAYCGLATSACWAGIATPGASAYLTSTARSVPTLDQVSRIQTPGYMSAGRNFDSFVLSVTDGAAAPASAPTPSAPEITAVNAAFGVNNGGFQVDTASFSSFDNGASQAQFVNLLAGATTIGSDTTTTDSGSSPAGTSFSTFSLAPADSGSVTTTTDGATGPSSLAGDPGAPAPVTSDTATKYNMAALGRVAAPQVIAIGDPVPEPSTGVAAGLATGFLAWMRLRVRRQK